MAILFRRSAWRHGVSQDRARFVVEHCPCPLFALDEGADGLARAIFLGPDGGGVPLEVVGIELEGGDLVVIHAMRMRRKYRHAYAEVMKCR